MIFLAKLCSLTSILYLIKAFLYPYFKPISKRHKKKTRQFIKAEKSKEVKEKYNKFKQNLIKKYGDYILTDITRTRYKKFIDRLDMNILPEEIRLNQIFCSILAIFVSLFMHKVNPFLGYISMIFIILGWIYPIEELEKKVEEKNKNIALDFPSFYSMVYYQYSKSVNIYFADVIKDYLPNASKDMAEELEVMLDNIEYGEAFALKQFKKRVPQHYIIKFCDIMEIRLNGYDNVSQMSYLKNEIDEYRIINLERELEKREQINERIQIVLIIVLAIYIIIYYLFTVLDSIKIFT